MKYTRILCGVAMLAMVASCEQKNDFKIDGLIQDAQFNGKTVYLLNGQQRMDSATIVDGKFAIAGKTENPWIGTLYAYNLEGGTVASLEIVVESGRISVDMINDRIGGTALNDTLQNYLWSIDNSDLEVEMNGYLQLYKSASTPQLRAQAEHLYDSLDAICENRVIEKATTLYNNNKDNALACYAMNIIANKQGITYSELNDMLSSANKEVTEYAPIVRRLNQLRCIEETSVGHMYKDVEGLIYPDYLSGKLSDIINGKVAIVDFWASWCSPCRAEIKDNLIPLWNKYKNKGLVIVGLNVWERGGDKFAPHAKAVADLGIEYPQFIDTTRTASESYGVNSIPQIMLIDKDGTILARDLRGAAIEDAIIKALAE